MYRFCNSKKLNNKTKPPIYALNVHTNPFSFDSGDLVSKTHRKFSVHTTTGKRPVFECIHSGERFRKAPFFGDRRRRICVNERPNRIKMYPFSNENGLVWTVP